MKYRLFKKRLVAVMATMAMTTMAVSTFASVKFTDVPDNSWAKPVIEKWANEGLVGGYEDGSFKPGNPITRAEFASLIQRAFKLTPAQGVTFKDVKVDAWYAGAIHTLAANGVANGYEDGTFRPNAQITRAEAAAMIANAKGLAQNVAAVNVFVDVDQIPAWAKGVVGAAVEAGFMGGYPDGTFGASKNITRAEAVSALDRAIDVAVKSKDLVITEAGVYSQAVEGDVYVLAEGVTLKDMTINGDLILGEQIGEGDATLEGVVVVGNIEILGGGANSIYIRNSKVGNVVVAKANNSVRIVAEGTSTFGTIFAKSGVKLEEKNLVNSEGFVKIVIEEGATGEITLEGTFDEVEVKAEGIALNLPTGTKIANITIQVKITVKGQGQIVKAIVNAEGVGFDRKPDTVEGSHKDSIIINTTGGGNTSGSGGTPGPGPTPIQEYNLLMTYTGFPVSTISIPKGTETISAHLVKSMYGDLTNLINGIDEIKELAIRKVLNLNSTNGTNYAKQIAKDLLAYEKPLNIDISSIEADLEAIINSDKAQVAADKLVDVLLTSSIDDLIEDFEAIYPEKQVSDIRVFGFEVKLNGELLDGSVKFKDLEDAITAKLNGVKISELKETYIKIGTKTLEIKVAKKQ
jgi:hypothetical protein